MEGFLEALVSKLSRDSSSSSSYHLVTTYQVLPGTELSVLYEMPYLIVTLTKSNRYYHPHFTEEGTEA